MFPLKFHRFKSNLFQSGHGFELHYTMENCEGDWNEGTGVCSTFCGGNYTSVTGVLRSPGHPQPYPPSRDCIYLISQPIGTIIQITINKIDILCDDFGGDYIEMRDGYVVDSPVILRHCGKLDNIPISMQTTQNFLWIR